jgi:hypothetical protein
MGDRGRTSPILEKNVAMHLTQVQSMGRGSLESPTAEELSQEPG